MQPPAQRHKNQLNDCGRQTVEVEVEVEDVIGNLPERHICLPLAINTLHCEFINMKSKIRFHRACKTEEVNSEDKGIECLGYKT